MRKKFYNLSIALMISCIIIGLTSCKNDKNEVRSVVTSVYEVDFSETSFAAGALRYMEEVSKKNGNLFEKSFYDANQNLKGREVYQYDKKGNMPSGSKYFDGDGVMLSKYEFSYIDTLKAESKAYDGENGELLRIERFKYDDKGNMVSKIIYDANNVKDKSFLFSHDQHGNETLMVVTDKDDNKITTEIYEIIELDTRFRWLERYGYVNDNLKPKTFYKRSRND